MYTKIDLRKLLNMNLKETEKRKDENIRQRLRDRGQNKKDEHILKQSSRGKEIWN